MKTDLLKFWSHRSEIKLNKKVFVFIICLLISFFSWLQINLSKKVIENLPVKLEFSNLPKTRFGTSKIYDTLFVEVEANGYDLMKYEMKEMEIDFKKLKRAKNPEAYYFLPNNHSKTIANQLGDNYKLIRAIVDTIQLNPSLQ